jgi:hypothetical protein
MVDSEFVFDQGEPINIGSPGDHDFVLESGTQVNDSGVSGLVFEAGTGLGGGDDILEDFEDPFDASQYDGTTGLFDRVVSPVQQGDYAGRFTVDDNTVPYMARVGDEKVVEGKTYRGYVRFQKEEAAVGLLFMYNGTYAYQVNLEESDQTFEVGFYQVSTASGGSDEIAVTTTSFERDTWYQVDFRKDGSDISCSLFNSVGTEISSISGTDDRLAKGGYGWQLSSTRPGRTDVGYYDNIRIVDA